MYNDELKSILTKMLKDLRSKVANVSKRLSLAPSGSISSYHNHGYVQYHHYYNKTDHFLPKSKMDLIQKLFQKKYDADVLPVLEAELSKINELHKFISTNEIESIEASSYVKKVVLSDEEYALQWSMIPYKHREVSDSVYKTSKGECVRSKSEALTAEILIEEGYPYKYEFPYNVFTPSGEIITIRPDFTVLNKRTRKEYIVEYFGMMDNSSYVDAFIRKMDTLQYSGLLTEHPLISIFETKEHPFDRDLIIAELAKYLK